MLNAIFIGLLALVAYLVLRPGRPSDAPPSYGSRWLPSWPNGILAVARLGKEGNEDAFLSGLPRPAVFLPWPMNQYFITDGEAIRQAYAAPSSVLSFLPIRREMQGSAFGAVDYWKDKNIMEKGFFVTHAKGMSKTNLTASLERFVVYVRGRLEELVARVDASPSGETELNLGDFVADVFFRASCAGMFGPKVFEAKGTSVDEIRSAFDAFDKSFPIEASGLVPSWLLDRIPDVQEGRKAREVLARTFEAWINDGFEGLEEGVVRDMAQVALDNNLGSYEAGKMLVADFWALHANAQFICTQLLIYFLQSPPSLRSAVQAEIDTSISIAASSSHSEPFTFSHVAETLPLVGSCIVETLRLGTSTLSIRDVEKPFVIPAGKDKGEYVIPAGTRLVCATRIDHLDDARYDGNAGEWDGRRFFDGDEEGVPEEEKGWKSRRGNQVYGFGGGISRCEGQHLATAEMKTFMALLFESLDVELVSPRDDPDFANKYDLIKVQGVEQDGWKPKSLAGRVGMGAFQLRKESPAMIRVRRRKQQT
ncbi:hypothetical protein JCM8547_004790 [Rhodosporidiobolus lusitaniae]